MDKNTKTKWAEIVAKAWIDDNFKKELLANPTKILQKHGIDMRGVDVQILENSNDKCYFVIPHKPEGNLSQTDLSKIAAASWCDYCK